ncbi:uncharacterized protein PHACADRAFT_82175 [Phanerochaete carnosa HHB-10118-sp]|uniref:Uncharacterized protein n=1 Tax=Phanerochaete carnosa (strain HHB-10118-sp) TaxID=650164 RepID=K5VCB1_PHACS|nr:uncharacterized protein PHACADRAFT_82175 [Phanerochaete carnosa HHB-10118-sp]EKM60566.1 hypothetical protein PHACADRAFT_82175 [Phanerochaete carnosa HHB-10118-sp]
MLPTPVSYHTKRDSISRSKRPLRDVLLARARVTNLGLCILICIASVSLLVNLGYYSSSGPTTHLISSELLPHPEISTVEHDSQLLSLDHLVMVPGHAIWKGSKPGRVLDEENWLLEPYQATKGRLEAFYNHIARGVETTLGDEHALLVFSGGQTKKTSTTTEAESYLRLAHAASMLPEEHFTRVTTEDDALDSYQNLLFSIARFHEYAGRYPSRITVVGYEFKRRRFTELHRAALRWPDDRFHYIGIDAEGEDLTTAQTGEVSRRENGFLPYAQDVYGCHDFLLAKRRSRNVANRFHSYFTSSPELAGLFNWCPGPDEGGQTALYAGPLPWDYLR